MTAELDKLFETIVKQTPLDKLRIAVGLLEREPVKMMTTSARIARMAADELEVAALRKAGVPR